MARTADPASIAPPTQSSDTKRRYCTPFPARNDPPRNRRQRRDKLHTNSEVDSTVRQEMPAAPTTAPTHDSKTGEDHAAIAPALPPLMMTPIRCGCWKLVCERSFAHPRTWGWGRAGGARPVPGDTMFDQPDCDAGGGTATATAATDDGDAYTMKHMKIVAAAGSHAHTVVVTADNGWVWVGGKGAARLGLGRSPDDQGMAAMPDLRVRDFVCMYPFRSQCVRAVACGANFSVALTDEGSVFAWGDNTHGQLGLPIVDTGSGFYAEATACAPPPTRSYVAYTQLFADTVPPHADVAANTTYAPVRVVMPDGRRIRAIACGCEHTAAITDEDSGCRLVTWGSNARGQLGRPSNAVVGDDFRPTMSATEPAYATGGALADVGAIDTVACGTQSTAVVALRDGSLIMCGSMATKSKGCSGAQDDSGTPCVVAEGFKGRRVCQVAFGTTHVAAVTDDGELFTWGDNSYGQLGYGSDTLPASDWVPTPHRVLFFGKDMARPVVQVYCDDLFTAVVVGGSHKMYAFGHNTHNQFGLPDASIGHVTRPVFVVQFTPGRDPIVMIPACDACQ